MPQRFTLSVENLILRHCGGVVEEARKHGVLSIFHQVLGLFLVLTGLIVLPLPIPFGLIMITIGCALLAPYIPAVQRFIRRMRARSPDLNAWLMKYRRRFPPVIRRTIAKTHPRG